MFHVDDLKCCHRKKTVNDDFAKWLEKTYEQCGKVKVHQEKVHDYLGMKLDYSQKKKIKIDMKDYIKVMFESFPIKFREGDTAATPAGVYLFGQKSSISYNSGTRIISYQERKGRYTHRNCISVYLGARS